MSNSYYWAQEANPDNFNYEIYYSEDDAIYDNFWAGGNKQFKDINSDLRYNAQKVLENIDNDLDSVFDDNISAEDQDVEFYHAVRGNVHFYYPDAILSDKQLRIIARLSDKFLAADDSDEADAIICKFLEIINNKPYKHGWIHGSSQGDYMRYICQETLSDKSINYIEGVLFATGTEYDITDDMYTKEEYDSEYDDEGNYIYSSGYFTTEWSADEIKLDLARQIGNNTTPDQIKLLDRYGKEYN